MTAVTFEIEVKGGLIPIPDEYRASLPSRVLVTLTEPVWVNLHRKAPVHITFCKRPKGVVFSPPHINTQGWKWDREEANER